MQSYVDKAEDYFSHARKEIAPFLPAQCGRVLEIGCGSGATLNWLRHDRAASFTVGVEIFEAAAQSARVCADAVYCLDYEKGELPLESGEFDVILCLDVLEHMVDPWQVITRLVSKHLVEGGTLIVSLPNVRYFSVVLPLLFLGRWDYQEEGVLDRTHLRFFTRNTAVRLLSHDQLECVRCIGFGTDWPSLKSVLNVLTAGFFREILTYQYVLAARKIHRPKSAES
jgi:2-polyprenyl-3-methyl-5-hydroxy-6-metoxy-1,4-benzoquinol methylase